MDLFSLLKSEDAKNFISHAAQADITAWSVKIAIVWQLMGKKVNSAIEGLRTDFSNHFATIEKGFADLVSEMKQVKENVKTDLDRGAQRFETIETGMTTLSTRVEKLENKGEPK